MSATWPLKRPVVRRLTMHDGTRKKRPLFIRIEPEGTIEVWPRRCRREAVSARQLYIYAGQLRRAHERLARKKGGSRGRR